MARLSLYRSGKLAKTIELIGRPVLVGRDEDCDLVLQDAPTSRKHFRLSSTPGGAYLLEDLESENGTYVNGVREYRRFLTDKVTIQVGEELILFEPDGVQQAVLEQMPPLTLKDLEKLPEPQKSKKNPRTRTVPPAILRRTQAELRARTQPHLLLKEKNAERTFPLDADVLAIGYGPVRISLGPTDKGKANVVAEIFRDAPAEFRIKAKGLFGKVTVNGSAQAKCALKSGDSITIDGKVLVFHTGIRK